MSYFELGKVVMTQGINHLIMDDLSYALEIDRCIKRHANMDWGLIDGDEKEMNDQAAEHPGSDMIMSVYEVNGTKIWIITECGNTVTTILLPEEY